MLRKNLRGLGGDAKRGVAYAEFMRPFDHATAEDILFTAVIAS